MPLFIIMFILLFALVPWLLTRMAADLIGIRTRKAWWVLFIVISVGNWEMWRAPKHPASVGQPVAGPSLVP